MNILFMLISFILQKNTYSFQNLKSLKLHGVNYRLPVSKLKKNGIIQSNYNTNMTKIEDCIFNFDHHYCNIDHDIRIKKSNIIFQITKKTSYLSIGLLLAIMYCELFKIDGTYLNSITIFRNYKVLIYYLLPMSSLTIINLDNSIKIEKKHISQNCNVLDYLGIISFIGVLYIFYYEYTNNTNFITNDIRAIVNFIKLYLEVNLKLKFDNI